MEPNADQPTAQDGFADVAALEDVPMNGQLPLLVNGRKILLCRIEEGVFAVADNCPHAHQTLGGGPIKGKVIRCPRHGACFDLTTGKSLTPISRQPLTTFAVRMVGNRVFVNVPPQVHSMMPNFGKGA